MNINEIRRGNDLIVELPFFKKEDEEAGEKSFRPVIGYVVVIDPETNEVGLRVHGEMMRLSPDKLWTLEGYIAHRFKNVWDYQPRFPSNLLKNLAGLLARASDGDLDKNLLKEAVNLLREKKLVNEKARVQDIVSAFYNKR